MLKFLIIVYDSDRPLGLAGANCIKYLNSPVPAANNQRTGEQGADRPAAFVPDERIHIALQLAQALPAAAPWR